MTSPFIDTSAHDDPNDTTTPTSAGGMCYDFSLWNPGDFPLSSDAVGTALDAAAFICPGDGTNGLPPIINNPVLDHPWTPPPPVTTGCYPLRARAQTISDEEKPEGITAEFADTEDADKCFPILDIILNTNPIIDQVLSIISPGGGGGGQPTLYNPLGCCCDEFGGFYAGDDNGWLGDASYSGKIGQCIGKKMPVGLIPPECTDDYCSGVSPPLCCQSSSCCPDGYTPSPGGIGVSWDNEDAVCGVCSGDANCCCDYAKASFSKLRPVGIGIVTDYIIAHDEMGLPYTMDLYLSEGSGLPKDENENNMEIKAYNLAEMGLAAEPSIPCGYCADNRYIPGITGVEQVVGYPGHFTPQPICPGASIVVFGITKDAADIYLNAINRADCYSEDPLTVGCFTQTETTDDRLIFFFTFENAHDSICQVE